MDHGLALDDAGDVRTQAQAPEEPQGEAVYEGAGVWLWQPDWIFEAVAGDLHAHRHGFFSDLVVRQGIDPVTVVKAGR